jgi:hypothetical protein
MIIRTEQTMAMDGGTAQRVGSRAALSAYPKATPKGAQRCPGLRWCLAPPQNSDISLHFPFHSSTPQYVDSSHRSSAALEQQHHFHRDSHSNGHRFIDPSSYKSKGLRDENLVVMVTTQSLTSYPRFRIGVEIVDILLNLGGHHPAVPILK